MDEPDKLGVNTWRVDDLDGGLSIGLSNLHGLGTQELMEDHTPAYDMTYIFLFFSVCILLQLRSALMAKQKLPPQNFTAVKYFINDNKTKYFVFIL